MPVCFLLSSMLFVYVLLIMMPILKCCLALSIGRCATVWLWMVFKWQQYRRLVRKRNEELWVETEETASRESRITPRPERNPQRTLSATYPHSLRGTSTTVCLPLACIRPVNLPLKLFMLRILSLWEKLDVNDSIDWVLENHLKWNLIKLLIVYLALYLSHWLIWCWVYLYVLWLRYNILWYLFLCGNWNAKLYLMTAGYFILRLAFCSCFPDYNSNNYRQC